MPSRKASHGKKCPYCKRTMNLCDAMLQPTRDHFIPRKMGGREIIMCCWQCNNIKGDMVPAAWESFMVANPGWWTLSKKCRRQAIARGRIRARPPPKDPRRAPVIVPPELIYPSVPKILPLMESKYILDHGKRAYRDAVESGEFGLHPPRSGEHAWPTGGDQEHL